MYVFYESILMRFCHPFSLYFVFHYGRSSNPDNSELVSQLRAEVEWLRYQLRHAAADGAEVDNIPTIFVITPTYARPVQIGINYKVVKNVLNFLHGVEY